MTTMRMELMEKADASQLRISTPPTCSMKGKNGWGSITAVVVPPPPAPALSASSSLPAAAAAAAASLLLASTAVAAIEAAGGTWSIFSSHHLSRMSIKTLSYFSKQAVSPDHRAEACWWSPASNPDLENPSCEKSRWRWTKGNFLNKKQPTVSFSSSPT